MMRRIKQFVPKSTLVKIDNAIVLSHFDYCCFVWDNCCDYLKNRPQKYQDRAAWIITGKTYEVSSEDVLKELDWQPLNQRYKTNKSVFMHRIRNEKMPSSISNMFKIRINDRYDMI
jgi:hypothetical protein